MRVAVCIPVYNDWTSARVLLGRLDQLAEGLSALVDVLFVDDGSSEMPSWDPEPPRFLAGAAVLELRRNLGHQRAIAIGLSQLYTSGRHDLVVVMDGDGEDDPLGVSQLMERCEDHGWQRVVFAGRTRRAESAGFKLGYLAFQVLHRLLVGRRVNVGNFCVVPHSALRRLVAVGEIWNHFAAAVYHSRIPTDVVPLARAPRIAGRSKMNFVSLVMHGLSAISVHRDLVFVRALMWTGASALGVLLAIGVAVAVRLGTDLAIPGWATNAVGLLLAVLGNLVLIGLLATLFALRSRSEYAFLPLRDFKHYVLAEHTWHETRT